MKGLIDVLYEPLEQACILEHRSELSLAVQRCGICSNGGLVSSIIVFTKRTIIASGVDTIDKDVGDWGEDSSEKRSIS